MKFLPVFILALVLVCPAPLLHADDAAQRTVAAGELIDAMHLEKILAQTKQNIIKMMAGFSKDQSPEVRERMEKRQNEMFDSLLKWETLRGDYIKIYSEVYTEKELKDVATFYKSPTGQKFLEKMPELQQKSMLIVQKRVMDVMAKIKKADGDEKASGTTPDPSTAAPSATPK